MIAVKKGVKEASQCKMLSQGNNVGLNQLEKLKRKSMEVHKEMIKIKPKRKGK